ncbi:MAG TPA: cytochrome P450 [Actinophytocola sp.]|uniref:cytochrome P450 n=1 Tax=Actinophytocola sp. TaxID=1872138 RepID=UPI002DDC9492|nr:cytochrome P450 [Actinophytocola sp.]HEV2782291.1 cytochrome P450 [Actinophytocola sp.]
MTAAVREPVQWVSELGAFVVTGFDEASAVLRGPGWSSDPRRSPLAPPELATLPPGAMLFMDPPDHTRLRRLIAPAFAPKAIEHLRPRVAAIVAAVLDDLPSTVDLLSEVGYVVPLAVIAELLDVGTEGAGLFRAQTPRLVRMLEVDATPDDLTEATAASLEITMFLLPLLTSRRSHPGNDFISALLAVPDLTLDEVLATCILLLAAGHETTANLITNGTLALLEHPAQLPHLLAAPASAVEELLRFTGPVRLAARVALTDHDLAGHPIPRGSQVLVRLDSANRDPRRYPDPDRLDLTRPGPPNLAFGAGPHFCLGAALARLEATETLTALFTRYPTLTPTERPIKWRESTTFHGLESLPVLL